MYKNIFDKDPARIKIILVGKFACKDMNELRAREEEVRYNYNNKGHQPEADKTEIIQRLKNDNITMTCFDV